MSVSTVRARNAAEQSAESAVASTAMTDLPDWARQLNLAPHPEGGWYRETWRSDVSIPQAALPPGYPGARSAGTAILFLLMPGQQSAWHTVRSAEMWLFHRGSPLLLEVGPQRATADTLLLGADITAGQRPQLMVPPGHWQRARPRDDEPTLVSCVVVPGFDFADFALAAADQ
jgi:uncharacterized protein